ncbi:MAG: rRNA maturation RNase YbeY [Muribaculaceae bacterium]|nr:rRNA maturation RNase YbeY [Muribaculaceae bacterium]MDE6835350.1 rRNA maturation RNase YbeY [Muribaculaceae bacterium]
MIEFFTENVALPDLDYSAVERWIGEVAQSHGFSVGNLTYCFCDDPYILEANNKFLGHDYYTDIITFDYTRRGRIGGDMIISLDTVRTNAEGLGVTYRQELLRVIIHGVLHLCGINDKGPGEREIMEANENKALSLL